MAKYDMEAKMTIRVVTMWYRRLDCERVSSGYRGEENSHTHDRDVPGHGGEDAGGDEHDGEDDPGGGVSMLGTLLAATR